MSRPGTRFFIGPLTMAQRRKREASRSYWRLLDEISYARNIMVREAIAVERRERDMYWTTGNRIDYP